MAAYEHDSADMDMFNRFGITPEEYDEAMEEASRMHMGDDYPTEEDDLGMHVDYVVSHVIPEGHEHPLTAMDWTDIADAMDEVHELNEKYPSGFAKSCEESLTRFAKFYGFVPSEGSDMRIWADERAREAAYYQGEPYTRGDRSLAGELAPTTFPDRIEDVPFNKMLDFRMDHGQAWTPEDGKMLNEKIIAVRDAIEQEAYEGAMQEDMMHAEADDIDRKREADGIQGDEPDIPWYEARDHKFGKPAEDLHAEADEFGENVGRTYTDDMYQFYETVFAYDNRDFEGLPAETIGQCQLKELRVSRATYNELGSDYDAFYQAKLQEYAKQQVERVGTAKSGIDFSRGITSPNPYMAQKQASQAKTATKDLSGRVKQAQQKFGDVAKQAGVQSVQKPVGDYGDND